MIALYVKTTKEYGRGVYALNGIISRQEIMLCETIVLSKEDTVSIQSTLLKFYTYTMNLTQDLICLGLGSLLNHSDKPNVSYAVEVGEDGKMLMRFNALRCIERGEQLFIDYKADCPIDLNEYMEKR
jgi:SET domain-containing protein